MKRYQVTTGHIKASIISESFIGVFKRTNSELVARSRQRVFERTSCDRMVFVIPQEKT